jgi:hypothetical protein
VKSLEPLSWRGHFASLFSSTFPKLSDLSAKIPTDTKEAIRVMFPLASSHVFGTGDSDDCLKHVKIGVDNMAFFHGYYKNLLKQQLGISPNVLKSISESIKGFSTIDSFGTVDPASARGYLRADQCLGRIEAYFDQLADDPSAMNSVRLANAGYDKTDPLHRETLRLIILSSVSEDLQADDIMNSILDPTHISVLELRDTKMRVISNMKFYIFVIGTGIAAFKSRKLLWGGASVVLKLIRRMVQHAMKALHRITGGAPPSSAILSLPHSRTDPVNEVRVTKLIPLKNTCPKDRRPLDDSTCRNGLVLRTNPEGFLCCYAVKSPGLVHRRMNL